ncbi:MULTISPECIES: ATP-grasp domain-containing protein [Streptomyces]|uniref:ATP-grasp domain-containing protein n=1 Tax=Streptomyces TaxID=1883 RepID=UPI00036B6888|nr:MULTISPECIES: biotin carboxylase [Streptomyces]MBO1285784.1 biotin carboxylase [Streptomyces sampsonii]MYW59442.1 biotin carboxylase [Streptomyces sp. SID8370]MYW84150.1 biotin carboxylase [Streptomyces sp. SID8371]WAC96007.1 biotin carboxylase [Streptomyces sp. NA13]
MSEHAPDEEDRPHIVVINRWRERYADYAGYLDHATHRVTYVSTDVGLGSVPATAAGTEVVAATDDLPAVRAAVARLAARHGAPRALVALKEDDLLTGAELRTEWELPGPRPEDLVRFRDKYLMCRAVAAAGLPVPAFAAAERPSDVREFAGREGWPVVLKPRIGSSSAGVRVLDGPEELPGDAPFAEPMLVQSFDARPIHHADGVFDGTRVTRLRLSRYVNTCLGFREGTFLGSVEVDDPAVVRAAERAATAYLAALTDAPTPFHLELFIGPAGEEAGPDCSFLEVGARVGGSEIPFIWRDLHGHDLMRTAFDLQLGRTPAAADAAATGEVGGWLLIPAPAERPCLITHVTSMTGLTPGPYAEVVLAPGGVLPEADAYYEHVGGRFRFRGRTSAEVTEALIHTATRFRVSAEPILRSTPAGPSPNGRTALSAAHTAPVEVTG